MQRMSQYLKSIFIIIAYISCFAAKKPEDDALIDLSDDVPDIAKLSKFFFSIIVSGKLVFFN